MNKQSINYRQLVDQIKVWASNAGLNEVFLSPVVMPKQVDKTFSEWLKSGYHGTMQYLVRHHVLRTQPDLLLPGVKSAILVLMPYLAEQAYLPRNILNDMQKAYVSRYALGRDYHKVIRQRLKRLVLKMIEEIGDFQYRICVDSAPIPEVSLARLGCAGWQGKHTLLINHQRGSFFFIGEVLTDLPLPIAIRQEVNHCGSCSRCIESCPTKAIVKPYQLDARRCISYLTIELSDIIPEPFRALIGNRIYGCDDCQLVCPWNRFARFSDKDDFAVRHKLDNVDLLTLWYWSEADFQSNMAGSAIYRIGYQKWLSNIAIALGNISTSADIMQALSIRIDDGDHRVSESVRWALVRHQKANG